MTKSLFKTTGVFLHANTTTTTHLKIQALCNECNTLLKNNAVVKEKDTSKEVMPFQDIHSSTEITLYVEPCSKCVLSE